MPETFRGALDSSDQLQEEVKLLWEIIITSLQGRRGREAYTMAVSLLVTVRPQLTAGQREVLAQLIERESRNCIY